MPNHNRRLQHARPFWISALDNPSQGQPLKRMTFTTKANTDGEQYDESWLQRLLHRNPQSLPITELEPGIGDIVPVALEVPTPAGFVDNLFVTTTGNIVLVECKLWRNPEARRRVIAQIIDYAQSISRWSYEDLDTAIRKSLGTDGQVLDRSLIQLVSDALGDGGDIDEIAFIDAVQRNLRMGRMLLLVVGDGIREDVESLADYLQMHAGFHFTLGLIEVAIFSVPAGGVIVQPRVLGRTLNIERAVVRLIGDGIAAEPVTEVSAATSDARSMTLTEELFFEKLAQASPDTSRALNAFLKQAEPYGVFLSPASKSASLKWESPHGSIFNLGGIDFNGRLQTYSVSWTPHSIGQLQLGHQYLERLAEIADGTVRQTPVTTQWYIVRNGTVLPSAFVALSKADAWLTLIREYQEQLNFAENGEAE